MFQLNRRSGSRELVVARRLAAHLLGAGLITLAASPALAQRAAENAVASADDAFGSTVGTEKIGIYSDQDIRGFNPVKAGNLRIEGVYFDQLAGLTGRIRSGQRIRVGVAALDYPFPAPSGIVDYQLRPVGKTFAGSLALLRQNFGGQNIELDVSGPIVPGRLSLAGGITRNHDEFVDGAQDTKYAIGLIPRAQFDNGQLTLVLGHIGQRGALSRIIVAAPGAFLPAVPEPRDYIGQTWAKGSAENTNLGAFGDVQLAPNWSFRAGAFESRQLKHRAFSEIFTVNDLQGNSRHRIVADPRQLSRAFAGEAQLTWRADAGSLRQKVLFNVRARDKSGQSGGSDIRDLGPVVLGEVDPEARPDFVYRTPDESHIRQLTGGIGYMARYGSLLQLNAGLQKSRYEASFQRLGVETSSTDAPWLYNATLVVSPSPRWMVYGGTVRGLEESGVAPENAANRNETLPASRTTQYDGGVRVKLWTTQLVVSAFQIEKPYFSFDTANRFTALGQVRHRGVEASLSGSLGPDLTVIAGAVLMKPEVTGEARDLGRVGPRPVGVSATLLRTDLDYKLPVQGLSLTASVIYSGRRAASARTYAELGGAQLFTPANTTIDLGARYRFQVEDHPVTARVLLSNVLDDRSWKILAANSYQMNDTRRLAVSLFMDF